MFRKQEAPFTVKLELTEGCNLRCSFCGLNGIRGPAKEDNRFLYMTPKTAERIASEMVQLKWNSRLELALRGEPSFNPDRNAILATFRKHLPRVHIMMTTNGGGLLGKPGIVENLKGLFSSGLNVLAIDDYKDANIVPKIRRVLFDEATNAIQDWVVEEDIQVFSYPENSLGNPYRRHPATTRIISLLKDIKETSAEKDGVRDNLSNHCGAAGPLNDRYLGRRCARPFRELAIRYDGQLMLCCNDWRGVFKIGSIMDTPLDKLWQSVALEAARQKLLVGQRDFGPCKGCDSKSWRTGLLPDPMGKASLPLPNKQTERIIAKALEGPSMTEPVLRPWELLE